jgi:exonuclease III
LPFGLQKLECSKPVIVAGDLNCARQSIDIHNPQVSVFAHPFLRKILPKRLHMLLFCFHGSQ